MIVAATSAKINATCSSLPHHKEDASPGSVWEALRAAPGVRDKSPPAPSNPATLDRALTPPPPKLQFPRSRGPVGLAGHRACPRPPVPRRLHPPLQCGRPDPEVGCSPLPFPPVDTLELWGAGGSGEPLIAKASPHTGGLRLCAGQGSLRP